MSYSYPNNIPEQIKNLPSSAQKIWVSTYNTIVDEGITVEIAKESAWNEVNSEFVKDSEGNWSKKTLGDDNMAIKEHFNKTNDDKSLFKTFIPLHVKDGKIDIITKSIGDKDVVCLRGSASNTTIDKEDDQMDKMFISKMKSASLGLNVFAEHDHSIEKTVGYVDSVDGDDDNMIIDTLLEDRSDNDLVDKILKKIDHGIKIGYSIGGRVTKAISKFDSSLGRSVRKILDGEIYEISLTAMPAGFDTWTEPITKSLDKWIKPELESEPATSEEISKILDEILQRDELESSIYDLMWAFKSAISEIVRNSKITPTEKKEKIVSLGNEFGERIEKISTELALLEFEIDIEL